MITSQVEAKLNVEKKNENAAKDKPEEESEEKKRKKAEKKEKKHKEKEKEEQEKLEKESEEKKRKKAEKKEKKRKEKEREEVLENECRKIREEEKERQRLQLEEEHSQNRKVQESLNCLGQIALEDEQEWNSIKDRMTEQKVRRSERINSNRRRLEEDWVRNADGKDYGCPECGMWFFTGEGVRLHMDNAHSHKPNSSEINEKMSQGKSLRYGCTDCENSFPSELMAINHMRSHNEEEDGK